MSTPEGIDAQARIDAAEDMVRHLRDAMSEAEVYIKRRGLVGPAKVRALEVIDAAMTRCRLPIPRPRQAVQPTAEAIVCPGCDGLGCEPDECDGRTVERACRTCNGTGKVAAPPVVGDMEGPAG